MKKVIEKLRRLWSSSQIDEAVERGRLEDESGVAEALIKMRNSHDFGVVCDYMATQAAEELNSAMQAESRGNAQVSLMHVRNANVIMEFLTKFENPESTIKYLRQKSENDHPKPHYLKMMAGLDGQERTD
jgi:hypothetical protein